MSQQNELLAQALSTAKMSSSNEVVKSNDLDRGVRERLVHAGYLEEVMRGWYLLTTPTGKGTTTLWFSSYWAFVKEYLRDRFGENDYCLAPESSIELHSGQTTTPQQLHVLTRNPSNTVVELLHDTSLVLTTDKNFPEVMEQVDGINVLPLAYAICRLSPGYFAESSLSVEIAFKLISSVSELSRILLEAGSVASASRIAGVFKKMEEGEKAAQIIKDMAAAGFSVTPADPFGEEKLYLKGMPRLVSPYVGRITAMWEKMRTDIDFAFPVVEKKISKGDSLKIIEQLYKQDAYNSLSIEGYQVTEEMIAKIKDGKWNPDVEKQDSEQRNAMAAKGYYHAFSAVCNSVTGALNGKDAAQVLKEDLQNWYRELFAPSIQAQILKPAQLAGYRDSRVFIKGSLHVPLPVGAIPDSMETLFELIKNEESAAVRAVLGHFIFVFIHPYMDGNGRIGRFILNLMLVSGGYPWTVIRNTERMRYMSSLEEASVRGNILPFAQFVADEMKFWTSEVQKILRSS